MLEAIPRGIFSNDFQLRHRGRVVAELDVSTWREKAEVEIEGVRYRLYREGLLSGAFVLERDGQVLAQAVKPSAFRSQFEVETVGRRFSVRKISMWSLFGVFEGDSQIGSISQARWFTRRMHVDLPADWPIALQVFVFWLALLIVRREAAAAGA